MSLREKFIAVCFGLSSIVATCTNDVAENRRIDHNTIISGYYLIKDNDGIVIAEAVDGKKIPYKIIGLQGEKGYDIIFVQRYEQFLGCAKNSLISGASRLCTAEEIEEAAKKLESLTR